jgi:hypothetical protein
MFTARERMVRCLEVMQDAVGWLTSLKMHVGGGHPLPAFGVDDSQEDSE